MAQLCARLEKEISTPQIELCREIEKRQEFFNYEVKHIEAYNRSTPNSKVCWTMRRFHQTFRKSEEKFAELQKIIDKKTKEYELLNSPLSISVQLETSRQNTVPSSSVGYKHVHKGTPAMSKDAASYQFRELKREKSLIPVAPFFSHG